MQLKCILVHEHLHLTYIRSDPQVFVSNCGCLTVIAASRVIFTSRSFVFICVTIGAYSPQTASLLYCTLAMS